MKMVLGIPINGASFIVAKQTTQTNSEPWNEGDCDADGLKNALEIQIKTKPFKRPILDEDGCVRLALRN